MRHNPTEHNICAPPMESLLGIEVKKTHFEPMPDFYCQSTLVRS